MTVYYSETNGILFAGWNISMRDWKKSKEHRNKEVCLSLFSGNLVVDRYLQHIDMFDYIAISVVNNL